MLAQAAADDVEMTVGTVLAGICVMAALAGSLSVLSKWWTRYSGQEPVIPGSQRPLVRIPLALLGLGLLIALMMSALAVSASLAGGGADFNEEQLVGALLQTVNYDIMLILILGFPVLLLKRRRDVVPGAAVPVDLLADSERLSADTFTLPSADNEYGAADPYAVTAVVPADGDPGPVPVDVEPWRLSTELRIAAEVCLAAWLPTAVLRVTMLALLQDDTQHPFLDMIQNGVGAGVLVLIAVTAVVLAPLMEELLYRVVILGGLLCRQSPADSSVFAVGLTSVLFAFAHGFPDSVALLPLAVAIAWTYHQRRSYRTVVLVHVLFNGFNIVLAGLSIL